MDSLETGMLFADTIKLPVICVFELTDTILPLSIIFESCKPWYPVPLTNLFKTGNISFPFELVTPV